MLRKRSSISITAGRPRSAAVADGWQLVVYGCIVIHVHVHVLYRRIIGAGSLCVADYFEPMEATEGAMHLLNRVRAAELELRRSDAEL